MATNLDTDEVGAKAIEVAAMLGDSVVDVKHCMDPKSGKITPRTWGLFAAGVACLLASAIVFFVAVHTAAFNKGALDYWTRTAHKPAHAYRPLTVVAGFDWIGFGGLGLGIIALGAALLRMRDEKRSPYYRIGTAPGVEQPIHGAPGEAFPLVAPAGDDFVLNFAHGIDGEMIVDGKTTPFAELAASGRAQRSHVVPGAFALPIPAHARIRANVGQAAFVVTAVDKPRRYATPLMSAIESRTLTYFAGSLGAHLSLVLLLGMLPVDGSTAPIDLDYQSDLAMRIGNHEHEDPPPPDEVVTRDPGSSNTEGNAAPMALASGAAGTTKSNRVDGHMRMKDNNVDPQVARIQAIEMAREAGILGSVSLQSGAAFASLTSTSEISSGIDPNDVYGPLFGAEGEGHGYFGYGRTGFGPGGGCAGANCGIIGLDPNAYGKIGTGRRGMNGWDGPGGGGIPGRRHNQVVPPVVIGQPTGTGDLDKAIIRRYIKMNLNKIQYCYEKQLLAKPSLEGNVMVSFFITPTGGVKSSTGSGLDPTVSNCVAEVIGAIEFPRPNGGGGVQVNYPFTFHATK